MIAQDINVSYEEALQKSTPYFAKKLHHSVELIRKAEKIALMYDAEDGFYNTFSGGKDSQALFHVVKMAGVKFKTHMSLTSIDPPQVIRFVKQQYPSVILHKPKMSIFQDAIERKILPTMRVRWCCADFKESAGAGNVTLIGIRREESARRAKRKEVEVSSKKFSGNLEEFEQWSAEEILKKQKIKSKRKINEDEFSVKTDNEVRCINGKDSILISPIFDWTERDVWYFLNTIINAPHCPLYDEGYTRIGCILCPMSPYKSKVRDIQRFPHVKRGWIKAIKAIRESVVLQETNDCKGNQYKKNICATSKSKFGNRYTKEEFNDFSLLPQRNVSKQQEVHGKIEKIKGNVQPRKLVHPAWIRYDANWISENNDKCGVEETGYTEDEIAEAIFDWWISGKPYKQWYADKYLHLKFDFGEDENETT